MREGLRRRGRASTRPSALNRPAREPRRALAQRAARRGLRVGGAHRAFGCSQLALERPRRARRARHPVRGHRVPAFRVRGLGFRVQGSGFQGSGFRVSGFRVSGFRVQGSGFRVQGTPPRTRSPPARRSPPQNWCSTGTPRSAPRLPCPCAPLLRMSRTAHRLRP